MRNTTQCYNLSSLFTHDIHVGVSGDKNITLFIQCILKQTVLTRFLILKQTDTSILEQFSNITPFSMYK